MNAMYEIVAVKDLNQNQISGRVMRWSASCNS